MLYYTQKYCSIYRTTFNYTYYYNRLNCTIFRTTFNNTSLLPLGSTKLRYNFMEQYTEDAVSMVWEFLGQEWGAGGQQAVFDTGALVGLKQCRSQQTEAAGASNRQ